MDVKHFVSDRVVFLGTHFGWRFSLRRRIYDGNADFRDPADRGRILVAQRNVVDVSLPSVQWDCVGRGNVHHMERNLLSAKLSPFVYEGAFDVCGTHSISHLPYGDGLPDREHSYSLFFYKKIIMTKMLKIPYVDVKNKKRTRCGKNVKMSKKH